jgi:hypothetical protein
LREHYSIEGNPVPEIGRDWHREVTELLLNELREDLDHGSWTGNAPEDNPQLATAFALIVLGSPAKHVAANRAQQDQPHGPYVTRHPKNGRSHMTRD